MPETTAPTKAPITTIQAKVVANPEKGLGIKRANYLNLTASCDISSEVVSESLKINRGKSKSGRFWKEVQKPARSQIMTRNKDKKLEKRMQDRQEKQMRKEYYKQLKEEQRQDAQAHRERYVVFVNVLCVLCVCVCVYVPLE